MGVPQPAHLGAGAGPEAVGRVRIAGLVGGFHLTGGIFEPIIEPTVEAFATLNVGRILPAHCTGWKAVHLFAHVMPESFVQPAVGTVVSF